MYLDLSFLDISKIAMDEYWYDYIKPKYRYKAKLGCTNTDSLIVRARSEDICEDFAEDVKTRFDT